MAWASRRLSTPANLRSVHHQHPLHPSPNRPPSDSQAWQATASNVAKCFFPCDFSPPRPHVLPHRVIGRSRGGQSWTAAALLVKETLAGIARRPGASRDDEDKSREKSMAIPRGLRSLRWRERGGWKRFAVGLAGKERKLAVPAGLYTWRTWLATEPAAIRLQLANAICQSGPEWGAQQTAGLLGWAHNRPRKEQGTCRRGHGCQESRRHSAPYVSQRAGLHMSQGWICPKLAVSQVTVGSKIPSSQNPKSQNNSWSSELPDRTVTPPTKPEPRRVFLRTTSG